MNYYNKFIFFLKRHNIYDKNKYEYLLSNTTFIDTDDEVEYIGCYYTKNEYNYITGINLVIPNLDDDVCVMIAIHEYIHGYIMYDKLNKQYSMKASEEVLPMFYEYLYYLENQSDELEKYRISTIDNIEKENKFKYVLGLTMQNELSLIYKHDFNSLNYVVTTRSPYIIKSLKINKSQSKI